MRYILCLIILLTSIVSAAGQSAIGQWRDHLNYSNINTIAIGNQQVFAAADLGVFYYDTVDHTTTRLNKTTGLSDMGIATIAYDTVTSILVIAYNNANIDLYHDGTVYNISGIYRSSLSGSKQIHSIRFFKHKAYLSCSFGIVVLDLDRHEISDTYYIGADGTQQAVYDIAFYDSLLIAATEEGLKQATIDDPFLNIASRWTVDETSPLSGQPIAHLAVNGNTLIASIHTTDASISEVYRLQYTNSQWVGHDLLPWISGNLHSLHCTNGKIVLSLGSCVKIYSSNYQLLDSIGNLGWMTMQANDATLAADGTLWVGTAWYGLAAISPNTHQLTSYQPTGPASDDAYQLITYHDRVFICPGGKTATYNNAFLSANLYTLVNNSWQQLKHNTIIDTLHDIIDLAVNPKDSAMLLAASWGHGILEINSNTPTTLYSRDNTAGAIQPYTSGNYTSYRTGSVAFDKKGNAWFTNSLQTNGLVVRYADGSWASFATDDMVGSNEIDHIIWDSVHDYKWFYGRNNRIYVHDGERLQAYVDPNNGSKLETSSVTCLVQDHDGTLWIGTNKGIKMLNGIYNVFANGGNGEKSPVTCSNIVISSGDIAEYLMAYESITCMAVDGANRKWVGTATGGLYLISSTGLEEIQHFTTSNSPLFSNKIISIAIQPLSGEVFIATDQGLQSYRSTATYATASASNDIYAYPNPVRPDYHGAIAIKGFSRNALVHITDASGHVVYSTTAQGGQAVWYGKTNSGDDVGSGVYFVFGSDSEGAMRVVTKILVIR